MPDEDPRAAEQRRTAARPHMSQHTSSHATGRYSVEHTPTRVPVPPDSPLAGLPGRSPLKGTPGPGTHPLRVVVADDNPVVRAGLTVLLEVRDDVRVVAEAADGSQAYEAALRHRPDVVLLDVRMPGVDGITALPHLARLAPVLMLTYSRESAVVEQSLRLGAGGYLVHGEFTAGQLLDAVREIKDGGAPVTASARRAFVSGAQRVVPGPAAVRTQPVQHSSPLKGRSRPATDGAAVPYTKAVATGSGGGPVAAAAQYGLSGREGEVMGLIAAGMTNSRIADVCFISEKTVKNHINRIFAKLRTSSRSESIAVWLGTARRVGEGPDD